MQHKSKESSEENMCFRLGLDKRGGPHMSDENLLCECKIVQKGGRKLSYISVLVRDMEPSSSSYFRAWFKLSKSSYFRLGIYRGRG